MVSLRLKQTAVALALVLAGCVSAVRELPDGTRERISGEAIRAYAEEVFRHHNAVATALVQALPALEAGSPDFYERLLDAEGAMYDACEPVNALAIAFREGEQPGLRARLALPRTLNGCEQQTLAVERLLAETGYEFVGAGEDPATR